MKIFEVEEDPHLENQSNYLNLDEPRLRFYFQRRFFCLNAYWKIIENKIKKNPRPSVRFFRGGYLFSFKQQIAKHLIGVRKNSYWFVNSHRSKS